AAVLFFFFQAEDGIRDFHVTGVQTCALPILSRARSRGVVSGTPLRWTWPPVGTRERGKLPAIQRVRAAGSASLALRSAWATRSASTSGDGLGAGRSSAKG